jgi:Protein of unknown function (DUF3072)
MTAEQAALLRKLAFDAYEPDAFRPNLTQAEASQRIDAAGKIETDQRTAAHTVMEFVKCRSIAKGTAPCNPAFALLDRNQRRNS